jgi:hypothetical protein
MTGFAISEFESSRPANQSAGPRNRTRQSQKCLPTAGFCNSAAGLWPPNSANCEAISPKVSGHYRKYSRFREIGL